MAHRYRGRARMVPHNGFTNGSSPFNLSNCAGATRQQQDKISVQHKQPSARPMGGWVTAGLASETPQQDDPRVLESTQSVNAALQMLNQGLEWPHNECFVYSQSQAQWYSLTRQVAGRPQSISTHEIDPKSLPASDNPLFQQWVMGGEERIQLLRRNLAKISQLPQCAGCMVLTNGFDDDVERVLKGVGLLQYFDAIVGTQPQVHGGGCISFMSSRVAERVRLSSSTASHEAAQTNRMHLPEESARDQYSRYNKADVMSSMLQRGCFEGCRMQWVLQTFDGPIDEIVYVDDHLEVPSRQEMAGAGSGDVRTVELPHEGTGLDEQSLGETRLKMCATSSAATRVVCVLDFDCTLSYYHMFKATNQDTSQWRQIWNIFLESQGVLPAPAGWRPAGHNENVDERAGTGLSMSPSPLKSKSQSCDRSKSP